MPIFAFGLMSPIPCKATSLVEGVMGSVVLAPPDSKVTDVGEISTTVAMKVMEFDKSASKSASGTAWGFGDAGASAGASGAGAFLHPAPSNKGAPRAMEKKATEPRRARHLGLWDGFRFFLMFFVSSVRAGRAAEA